MSKLSEKELMEFLKDHLDEGKTSILSKGSEYNELLTIAEKRGYSVQDSKVLKLFKNVYACIDKANGNKAILPEAVLKKLSTIIGKPVNINHIKNYVVGHIIDYRYNMEKKQIITYGVFYANNFPKEYQNIKNIFRQGKLGTSFEVSVAKSQVTNNKDGTRVLNNIHEFTGGSIVTKIGMQAEKDALMEEFATLGELNTVDETEDTVTFGIGGSTETVNELIENNSIETDTPEENPTEIVDNEESESVPDLPIEQIETLSVRCNCGSNAWKKVQEVNENKEVIQCYNCKSTYEVEYLDEKNTTKDLIKNASKRLVEGNYRCPNVACDSLINYSFFSNVDKAKLKCKKCGVEFSINLNTTNNSKRLAKSIEIIAEKATINQDKEVVMAEADKLKGIEEGIKQAKDAMEKEKVELINAKDALVDSKESEIAELKLAIESKQVEFDKLQAELDAKLKAFADEKLALIEQTKKVVERRQMLGDFAKDLTDEDLLVDVKFENAQLKQEIEKLKNQPLVSNKDKSELDVAITQPVETVNVGESIKKDIDKRNQEIKSYNNVANTATPRRVLGYKAG